MVAAEGSRDQDLLNAASPTSAVRASAAAAARRKPKRRTRNAEQQKKSRVTVRFDEAEKQRLKAEAKAAGLSMANLIARRTLGTDTAPTVGSGSSAAGVATRAEQLDAAVDELAATRTELGAWGNNLNQIARQLNMGGTLPPGPAGDFAHAAVALLPTVRALVAEVDERAHRLAKLRGRA
ncbi:plasmid mobilization protein [Streptacidiphilus melanogenes]|uniref:plasmid mobilization protein n=1 Tax=Streptacidiphilus melanogenes TaxID=411235 RepID=UPI0005A68457|nr:plasmid mobilization relaxosome protein MobC [Streptacidiphilus melanogenes]